MKIYVNYKHRNCEELLTKFFMEKETEPTFGDEKCTVRQCYRGQRRSIDDLIYLCKTYYEVSDSHISKIVVKLFKEKKIVSFYCVNIRKIVFDTTKSITHNQVKHWFCRGAYSKHKFSPGHTNWASPTIKGEGKYSFREIWKLAKL